MTKDIFLSILEEGERIQHEDEKVQGLYNALFNRIAGSSYAPVIDNTQLDSFIKGVSLVIPSMKDNLEYYFYEAMSMDGEAECSTKSGNKYNAAIPEEYWMFCYGEKLESKRKWQHKRQQRHNKGRKNRPARRRDSDVGY